MYVMKKQEERKDMFKVYSEQDIPEHLKDTVWIKDGHVECISAEGRQQAPLGTAFGSDLHAPTQTGKGVWPMSSDSYEEKHGKFYSAKEIRTAEPIDTSKGPVTIDTTWGPATIGQGEKGYFITRPNGENYILNMDTSSADIYMVCTEEGTPVCPLTDIKEPEREDAEENLVCETENVRVFITNEDGAVHAHKDPETGREFPATVVCSPVTATITTTIMDMPKKEGMPVVYYTDERDGATKEDLVNAVTAAEEKISPVRTPEEMRKMEEIRDFVAECIESFVEEKGNEMNLSGFEDRNKEGQDH